MFDKKTIMQKTFQVAGSTLISRFFGIIREVLMVRYLGASALSDAFLTAWKIPNSLRKIFAEGAMSKAFVPTLVKTVRTEGKESVNRLMSLGFIVFEGMVLGLTLLIMIYAETVIRVIAPGFSEQQILNAVPFLQVVMPFIFFISSSALLAGALQSVGHFFIPAFAPVLLNIVFIIALITCLTLNLPVIYLCWFILGGGILQFLSHLFMYLKLNFGFDKITNEDLKKFTSVLTNFGLCLISVSVMEISLFVDTSFASFLPEGSISLITYANRFVNIPIGVFAVAFSTILLPHFSHIVSYAPKRLSFYLLESTKFVLWVTLPVALIMGIFSEKIFYTIFLSDKFTLMQVKEAAHILRAFLLGLFFFSLNKVLLNMFYALQAAWIPALISACATIINVVLDYFFMEYLQGFGLALATTCSAIVQSLLFSIVLYKKFNFTLYLSSLFSFIMKYLLQIIIIGSPLYVLYKVIEHLLKTSHHTIANFLLYNVGFWVWTTPIALLLFVGLFLTRRKFNIHLYFLNQD